MKTCFHSHFYANFHASVALLFWLDFHKISPKCRAKTLVMIYTILGSFCSFFNCGGIDIRPQIRPRKIPDYFRNKRHFEIIGPDKQFFVCLKL